MSIETDTHLVDDCSPARVLGRVEEAVYALDDKWQFAFVNEQAASMLNRTPGELLGNEIWNVMSGLAETAVGDRLRESMATQTPARFEKYDEEAERWLTFRIYPAEDGVTVWFSEVTDERAERLDARRHRRLSETVFDETDDAMIVVDTDRQITRFNGAAERLFGYEASEVVGEESRLLYADPDGHERVGTRRSDTRAEGPAETHTIEYERAGGTTFEGDTHRTSLTSPNGQTISFLVSIKDISARSEHEREIEARNDAFQAFHDIATDNDRSVAERIDAVLELGSDHLGLDIGTFSRVDGDTCTVERTNAPIEAIRPGDQFELGESSCELVIDAEELVTVVDAEADETALDPVHRGRGIESYVGAPVDVAGERYGAISFSQATPRDRPFSAGECAFVRTLAQWIGTEMSRQRNQNRAITSRARLRQIIDLLPQFVFIKNEDNEYILANQAFADAFDMTVAAIEGSTDTDLPMPESEVEQFRTDDRAVVESGERKEFPERSLTTASGKTIPVQTTSIPYDPTGRDTEAVLSVVTEVTDAKRREWKLTETSQRLNVALNGTNAGIWELDLETGDVVWPESMERLFRLNPAEVDDIYEAFMDRIHPEDVSEVQQSLEDPTEDGDTLKIECRVKREDGGYMWMDARAELLAGPHTTRRLVGIAMDITEQKRFETSLRDGERALRELTSIASDADQTFEAKLTALLELGAERLDLPYGFLTRIEDDTQDIVQAVGGHPELQTGVSAPESETYCRETIQSDGPLGIRDAAAEGWEGDSAYERFGLGCYIGGTVVVNGETYGTLCFADDRSREHEFDDMEQAFVKLLVQWIGHELTTASFETKLRELNETAQRLMSVPSRSQVASVTIESARSILDMPVSGVWWHDEESDTLVSERMTAEASEYISEQPDFERGRALAWEAFDTGGVQVYNDLRAIDSLYNEETILRSEAIVPLGGHGILSVGSVEQRAFSETDRNLLEVLSSTVEAALGRVERETVLRRTKADLKQSNEELEQFAYAASHDLQEPLRTVSSYLTLLERRYGDELDDDAAEFMEFAVDGADRMRSMIQALLTYSRVDTQDESFESVDISALFERVVDDLKAKITETDAIVSTPATEMTVVGDQNQLAQLFQNLIENGIKYNTTDPEIDVSVSHRDEMVVFEVTDNGIGMETDQIDKIFGVFSRLHTREEFAGTGIGLSICRKIVDRHGGNITVDSEPGVGSTFTLTLPDGESADE